MSDLVFPPAFRWGVATAAYQIEGGWDADGKGPSVWDALAHRPGGLAGGATGDVACDHYHRVDDDLDLVAGLGVTDYRFSVSWPRVQPDGKGPWNERGLDFYDRLVDGLLVRGIAPALTLYHWDHPLALEDAGGWANGEIADRFADYAEGVAERLGDRVSRWITLNEPLSVTTGNILGFSRPAGPLGRDGLVVARHLLRAHGLAARRLRAVGVDAPIGIAVSVAGVEPASDAPADVVAAERAEAYEDRLFLDPLLLGRSPVIDGRPLVELTAEDLALATTPVDFLGVNWYSGARVAAPSHARGGDTPLDVLVGGVGELFGFVRAESPGDTTTMMGWPVVPDRLGRLLAWLHERYPNLPPVFITENGLPRPDSIDEDGRVRDASRIDYLARCLGQVRAAIDAGMDIGGYYVWSLLDNLEWGLGYEPRFGLVHVDFDTLARTPKDSYHWYGALVAAQRDER